MEVFFLFVKYVCGVCFSEAHDMLMDIYERLEDMDASTAESRAANILYGLGFSNTMQNTAVSCKIVWKCFIKALFSQIE